MSLKEQDEATRKRVADLADALDAAKVWTLPALVVLMRVHEAFPLPGSGMHEDFTGAHSLTLASEGRLQVNVWCDNKCWPLIFGP